MTYSPPTAALQYSEFTVSTRRTSIRTAAACGCGASDASGAQAAALAALATLAASCASAADVVNQNPLGRYANDGSCTYDCGFMEQTWSWWADYRATNANLAQAVTATDISGPYAGAFQPTQAWIRTSLPKFSSAINADLAAVGQIDAAIVQAGGQITPQQQTDLENAFKDVGSQLQDNLDQANQSLQNLASFLSWEQAHAGDLQGTVNGSLAFIKQNATGIENDLIGKIACGAGDVQNTFNAMFTDVNTKFATMQTGFSAVTSNLESAIQAGSRVAGVFLVLQSDSTLVSQQVAQVQSLAPTSPLRLMHLNIATQEWAGFVQDANTQLQAGSGTAEARDAAAARNPDAPTGLRMCRQMNVPALCRGALTHWRQLQAAIAELRTDDPSRPAVPRRNLPDAAQVGGPAQLGAALAIAPGLLCRPTPPSDLYGSFVWLALRVYEGSRSVEMTLRQLPALLDSAGGNRVAAGALLQEALNGNGGLVQRALVLRGHAAALAARLHAIGASAGMLELPAIRAGGGAQPEFAPASVHGGGSATPGMGAYAQARMRGHAAQQGQARQEIEAARETVVAVIGNMTLAVEALSGAWQATAAQYQDVASGDPRQLGNPDYLHTHLQVEPAVQDWRVFSQVIQAFVQGLLVAPPGSLR